MNIINFLSPSPYPIPTTTNLLVTSFDIQDSDAYI